MEKKENGAASSDSPSIVETISTILRSQVSPSTTPPSSPPSSSLSPSASSPLSTLLGKPQPSSLSSSPSPPSSYLPASVMTFFKDKNNDVIQDPDNIIDALRVYIRDVSRAKSIDELLEINKKRSGSPTLYMDQVGTGAIFGACAGYAVSKALRVGAFLCGVGFISLQVLNYYGYIRVNWERVEKDIKKPLDVNNDGQIDIQDISIIKNRFLDVLRFGLPSAAGLATGFLWALRKG